MMKNHNLFRVLDVVLSVIGLVFLWPILLLIYLMALFDTGSPLLRQERVGRHLRPFILIKFRTMKLGTPQVASHLVSSASVTKMGSLLRRTKLDELPQLWNVLTGDMSLVGPRPGLFNQHELIHARSSLGVYFVRPGITGLAQTKGIDMSTPHLLAQIDAKMVREYTLTAYIRYIMMTVGGKGAGDRVVAK
jgi:O-antigen biosynthesis protein WbqP